jgi:hypothetical protein
LIRVIHQRVIWGKHGTVLNDTHARAFWVLADAEGNEACICTWQDRD